MDPEFVTLDSRKEYGFPHDTIIYDKEGVPLKVGLLHEKFVPPFGQKSLEKVRDLTLRDDDIILIGYPKTGCHWTWEILRMIVFGTTNHSDNGKLVSFLELATGDSLENSSMRRVLNTHLWWENIPKQASEKKTKIVFTVRNPKDTAVSFYNHHIAMFPVYGYNGPFKDWFPLFVDGQVDYGSYFDYYQQWDRVIKNNPDQPILVLSFEDMKEDLPREIRKISKFLEVPLSDRQTEEIAKASGFDTMKEAYEKTKKISNVMIRKGQVGDWKNWLTVAQSETIDEAVEETLSGTIFSHQKYTI